jgi:hypothetical protein
MDCFFDKSMMLPDGLELRPNFPAPEFNAKVKKLIKSFYSGYEKM